MFMIVSTYLVKVGEEDAIIALHEDWQRNHDVSHVKNYVSWELFRKVEAPREFTTIAHYENEELSRIANNSLEQDAWFSRLVSLIEEGPIQTYYTSEWRLQH